MDLDPLAVKRRKVDEKHCIICFQPLRPNEDITQKPTKAGLLKIIDTCKLRKDDVFEALQPLEKEILEKQIKVSYHNSWRSAYTTKSNIPRSLLTEPAQKPSTSGTSTKGTAHKRISRTETSEFKIRKQCFICGSSSEKDEDLTPISTDTGETTREKVLSAAERRLDSKIHLRMLAHPDLFAYDAKYHCSCYGHYISELNIAAARRKVEKERSQMPYDKAFTVLVKQLGQTIFSKKKTVTTLSRVRSQFVKLLAEQDVCDPDKYSSWKMKERLQNFYGD